MCLNEPIFQPTDYLFQEMEEAEHFDPYPYDPTDGLYWETLHRMERDLTWLNETPRHEGELLLRYFGDQTSRLKDIFEFRGLLGICLDAFEGRGVVVLPVPSVVAVFEEDLHVA